MPRSKGGRLSNAGEEGNLSTEITTGDTKNTRGRTEIAGDTEITKSRTEIPGGRTEIPRSRTELEIRRKQNTD